MSEVTHQDICGVHEGGQCNCDWSAEQNKVFQAGYDACMRGQSFLTHPEGKDRNDWLNGWRKASEDYAEQHSPKPTHVTVPVEDIKRLEAIEKAASRLAYIVRKSVNAGPISNDPTAEGQAWRELRSALGEETPSTN